MSHKYKSHPSELSHKLNVLNQCINYITTQQTAPQINPILSQNNSSLSNIGNDINNNNNSNNISKMSLSPKQNGNDNIEINNSSAAMNMHLKQHIQIDDSASMQGSMKGQSLPTIPNGNHDSRFDLMNNNDNDIEFGGFTNDNINKNKKKNDDIININNNDDEDAFGDFTNDNINKKHKEPPKKKEPNNDTNNNDFVGFNDFVGGNNDKTTSNHINTNNNNTNNDPLDLFDLPMENTNNDTNDKIKNGDVPNDVNNGEEIIMDDFDNGTQNGEIVDDFFEANSSKPDNAKSPAVSQPKPKETPNEDLMGFLMDGNELEEASKRNVKNYLYILHVYYNIYFVD